MDHGAVTIVLDKPRTIRFSMNSFSAFEDLMGVTVPAFMMEAAQAGGEDAERAIRFFGFKRLRALLWAGLLDEDPSLKPEDVSELFEHAEGANLFEKMAFVYNAILQAFQLSQEPTPKKNKPSQARTMESSATGIGTKS